MNDYHSIQSSDVSSQLALSFDVYLHDRHTAADQIVALTHSQARMLLLDLWTNAPHAVARALAIAYPWSADVADQAERMTQDTLI